jgi:hypothetical protein
MNVNGTMCSAGLCVDRRVQRAAEPQRHSAARFANGTRYALDMTLGNVRDDIPIRGWLQTISLWKVADMNTDARSAWVTSRLEFFRHPSLMKDIDRIVRGGTGGTP